MITFESHDRNDYESGMEDYGEGEIKLSNIKQKRRWRRFWRKPPSPFCHYVQVKNVIFVKGKVEDIKGCEDPNETAMKIYKTIREFILQKKHGKIKILNESCGIVSWTKRCIIVSGNYLIER